MEEKLQNSEEDVALWNEYKKSRSPEIKEALILKYAPLVKCVAGRIGISVVMLSMMTWLVTEYLDLLMLLKSSTWIRV